jgi:hypothetical protein
VRNITMVELLDSRIPCNSNMSDFIKLPQIFLYWSKFEYVCITSTALRLFCLKLAPILSCKENVSLEDHS